MELQRPWRTAILQSVGEVTGKHLDEEELDPFLRLGPRAALVARLGPTDGRLAFDTFVEKFARLIKPPTIICPGLPTALLSLLAGGARMGLVSRLNRRSLSLAISYSGLADSLVVTMGEEELPDYPPDPSPVLKACGRLGTAADQTLLVSSDPAWQEAGRQAGTTVAGAGWIQGAVRSEWMLDRPESLIRAYYRDGGII